MRMGRLALTDLADDAVHLLCAVALTAALIAPLLLILSVKIGVIGVLLGDLRDLPKHREIEIRGDHSFTLENVAEVRAWPETGFVAPQSAAMISGDIRLKGAEARGAFVRGAAEPTGPGDPLTPLGEALVATELILSEGYARRLNVEAGDEVLLDLVRYGAFEGAATPRLRVAAVLPRRAGGGQFALMRPEAIDWIEAYGFDFAVPQWGVTEGRPLSERRSSFEKMRLYARDIEQVAALEARVERRFDLTARSEAAEIDAILMLERNLAAALAFIAGAGIAGLFFALAALFWGAVRRKRLTLSLLSLMGASPTALAAIPALQALAVSTIGFAAGLALFAGMSASVNLWFEDAVASGRAVSVLPATDAALVFCGLLVVSAGAAAVAAVAAMRADPALVIREA
ncbi:MAG: FtsX-like permease family protein [Pseudomonadota bacterium]